MANEAKMIWIAEGMGRLGKSPSLGRLTALYFLKRSIDYLRERAANRGVDHALLRPGGVAATALGDAALEGGGFIKHVRKTIEEAFSGPRVADLRRVSTLLDRRFADRAHVLPTVETILQQLRDEIAAGEAEGNPDVPVLSRHRLVDACRQVSQRAGAARDSHDEAAKAAREQFKSQLAPAEEQVANFLRASPVESGSVLQRQAGLGVVAGAIFLLLLLVGQPFAAWIMLAAAPLVMFLRERRQANVNGHIPPVGVVRLAHELLQPPADALERCFKEAELAALAAWETSLADAVAVALGSQDAGDAKRLQRIETDSHTDLAAGGEALFEMVHPGYVRLGGLTLARKLVEDRLVALPTESRVPALLKVFADAPSADELLEAAAGQIGQFSWAEVIRGAFQCEHGKQMMSKHLKALETVAATVVRMKPGRDKRLSPEVYTIGLPEGEKDVVAPWIQELFPHAQITYGFDPEGIEIVYDVCNISGEQLMTYEGTKEAYNDASVVELKLMHHPRRLTAQAEYAKVASGNRGG